MSLVIANNNDLDARNADLFARGWLAREINKLSGEDDVLAEMVRTRKDFENSSRLADAHIAAHTIQLNKAEEDLDNNQFKHIAFSIIGAVAVSLPTALALSTVFVGLVKAMSKQSDALLRATELAVQNANPIAAVAFAVATLAGAINGPRIAEQWAANKLVPGAKNLKDVEKHIQQDHVTESHRTSEIAELNQKIALQEQTCAKDLSDLRNVQSAFKAGGMDRVAQDYPVMAEKIQTAHLAARATQRINDMTLKVMNA